SGFWPGRNSMLSFATVAVSGAGEERGRFEAVLEELPGSEWNPQTRAWFESDEPRALAAAPTDPRDPESAMADFVWWVEERPGPRVFVASPLAFDGLWIAHYLRRFTAHGLLRGMYQGEGIFEDSLCLRSYAAAVTARFVGDVSPATLPAAWFGDVPHTHRAIDDAVGYAHLLVELFARSGAVETGS